MLQHHISKCNTYNEALTDRYAGEVDLIVTKKIHKTHQLAKRQNMIPREN